MRYVLLLLTLSAVVMAGCTSSRARRMACSPTHGSASIVHVSETYAEAMPSDGQIIHVSEVYSQAMPSDGEIIHVTEVYSAGTPVVACAASPRFVPPPPPALPQAEVRSSVRTTCVPAARPAPVRPVCVPACKPAAVQCVGGNCGIPDPCDPCPGGVCGVPSLDACAPPLDFDPCRSTRKR